MRQDPATCPLPLSMIRTPTASVTRRALTGRNSYSEMRTQRSPSAYIGASRKWSGRYGDRLTVAAVGCPLGNSSTSRCRRLAIYSISLASVGFPLWARSQRIHVAALTTCSALRALKKRKSPFNSNVQIRVHHCRLGPPRRMNSMVPHSVNLFEITPYPRDGFRLQAKCSTKCLGHLSVALRSFRASLFDESFRQRNVRLYC